QDLLRQGTEIAYVQRRGYRTERWTYKQIAHLAFRFGRELARRGIVKGDRLLVWGTNSAEWVAVFFGCTLKGVIVVPMDNAATPDFVLRVAQQVSAKLLVRSREHEQSSIPNLALDELDESLSEHSPSSYEPVPLEDKDVLEIVFTSGTTAEPKGVVITHGNVLSKWGPIETESPKDSNYE